MKWASALSREPILQAAVADAVEHTGRQLEQMEPDLVLVFVAGHQPADLPRVASGLRGWAGDALIVGCTSSGVVGGEHEDEEGPALALLAGVLGDVELTVAHLDQAILPPVTASRETWWRLTGIRPESSPCFLLLADPYSFDVEHCVRGLDRAYPGAAIVGGLSAAGEQPGATRLLAEADIHGSGALLVACTGDIALDTLVAQGCRPVGDPLFVTRSDDNRIRELDGRSPREVVADLYARLDDEDRALFNARQVFLGLALTGQGQPLGPGDFLARSIIGLDPESGELAVGARPAPNSVVQFQLRDAATAAADLARQLEGHRAAGRRSAPDAALMLSCVGRGQGLYGVANHDSSLVRRAFPELPLAGMFCAGEVGPVKGATFVHGYTTVLGLLRTRRG